MFFIYPNFSKISYMMVEKKSVLRFWDFGLIWKWDHFFLFCFVFQTEGTAKNKYLKNRRIQCIVIIILVTSTIRRLKLPMWYNI